MLNLGLNPNSVAVTVLPSVSQAPPELASALHPSSSDDDEDSPQRDIGRHNLPPGCTPEFPRKFHHPITRQVVRPKQYTTLEERSQRQNWLEYETIPSSEEDDGEPVAELTVEEVTAMGIPEGASHYPQLYRTHQPYRAPNVDLNQHNSEHPGQGIRRRIIPDHEFMPSSDDEEQAPLAQPAAETTGNVPPAGHYEQASGHLSTHLSDAAPLPPNTVSPLPDDDWQMGRVARSIAPKRPQKPGLVPVPPEPPLQRTRKPKSTWKKVKKGLTELTRFDTTDSGPFTTPHLPAEDRKPTYAEMLRRPAPRAPSLRPQPPLQRTGTRRTESLFKRGAL